jgi:hypothetical protein
MIVTNETSFTKLPAIEGEHGGCFNCGPRPSTFPAGGIIGVGFGCAMLTCDGRIVYVERPDSEEDDMNGAQAELLAAADPDHDWRIVLEAPMSSREYQRHGPDLWVLVRQGDGFA